MRNLINAMIAAAMAGCFAMLFWMPLVGAVGIKKESYKLTFSVQLPTPKTSNRLEMARQPTKRGGWTYPLTREPLAGAGTSLDPLAVPCAPALSSHLKWPQSVAAKLPLCV